jgi:hypothetical protein
MRIPGKDRVIVRGVAVVLCFLLLGSGDAMLFAQDAAPAEEAAPKLTSDQLDSLVAPIALYPDPLLSQALVASTYPLELIQAQQWLEKNKDLKAEALTAAAEKQNWDPSIQATVEVPDLLKRLTEDITWTTNLGNAFLDQQEDVMDAVQRLRGKAKDAGKLDTTEQQKVETKVVETKTIIEIQPASTQVVYVPTYSPTVIWGPPVYPYPPMYYPSYSAGAAWIGFGVGMAVGIGMSGGCGYGCGWGHGGGNNIYINNNNNFVRNNNIKTGNINSGNNNWQHNSNHRGGAPYSNKSTANKYGGNTRGGSGSASTRQAQGRNNASASNRQAPSRTGGASNTSANRDGAGNAGANRGSSGGGDRVGNRSIPKSSSGGGHSFSGASGGASSANRARASSSRGASSMGSRGGGGGRRR